MNGLKSLKGYKCHLAEDVISKNTFNERASNAMKLMSSMGKNNFVDAKNSDVIITMGGDGSMLRTIHHYHKLLGIDELANKTFFGFAFGTVNFLMNDFQWEDILNLVTGNKSIQSVGIRTLLIEIEDLDPMLVINDAVIGGNDLMSWLHYSVDDEENVFGSFEGTGLIFSTSVGSTAWNKNNGGVVLPLRSSNISVTGVGTNRPIQEVVHAQNIEISFKSRTDCYIWVDGADGKIGPYKSGRVSVSPGPWLNLGFFDIQAYQIKRRQI